MDIVQSEDTCPACAGGSKERLEKAAVSLFSEKWYGTVSVAEICRRAGLSNGCFYRYYHTKEELFRHILEEVTRSIAKALEGVEGDDRASRLDSFTRIVFRFSHDNLGLVRVFREGQYRFYEFEHRLKEIYIEGLRGAMGGQVDLAEYIFALGGLRFAAVRSAFQDVPVRLDALQDLLKHGLFHGMETDLDRIFNGTVTPLPFDAVPDARGRLLREGKKLFGKNGFFETNIHEITDAAGLSVGAFYTHFPSKEAFFAELIVLVGREVRHFITINLGENFNRLEREIRGLWLFLVYLSLDPYCYNIVREAEFVLPEDVRAYYSAFVKGYARHPEGSGGMDPVTSVEFLLGVAHYSGLEVVFDQSPANARALVVEIGGLLRDGLSPRLTA